MLPSSAIEILEYLAPNGGSPYGEWFDHLNPQAAAKGTVALTRISQGNFSAVKGVGGGVHECRIHFGPGYRIYFGKDGERIVIPLGGGTKNRQHRTSGLRWPVGKITNRERSWRRDSGPYPGFQRDDSSAGAARSRVPQRAAARGRRKLSFRRC